MYMCPGHQARIVSGHVYMSGVPGQDSERSCIHVSGVAGQDGEWSCIYVSGVPGQDSERSCIYVSGVPGQDSESSCIYVSGVYILSMFLFFLLDYGAVPTVMFFGVFFRFRQLKI